MGNNFIIFNQSLIISRKLVWGSKTSELGSPDYTNCTVLNALSDAPQYAEWGHQEGAQSAGYPFACSPPKGFFISKQVGSRMHAVV